MIPQFSPVSNYPQLPGTRPTVRFEERKSRGKTYHYWRAYMSADGKLLAKQVGKTEQLTKENLDQVGAYFLERSK